MSWTIKSGDKWIISNLRCPEDDARRLAAGISEEYGDPNVFVEAE